MFSSLALNFNILNNQYHLGIDTGIILIKNFKKLCKNLKLFLNYDFLLIW